MEYDNIMNEAFSVQNRGVPKAGYVDSALYTPHHYFTTNFLVVPTRYYWFSCQDKQQTVNAPPPTVSCTAEMGAFFLYS